MKFLSIFSVIALCAVTLFSACGNDGDAAREEAVESIGTTPAATQTPPPPAPNANPATPEPAQNAEGVWHYTCPNGCEGGAGTAANCAKCGGPLAHNQAYHGNQPTPTTTITGTPDGGLTPPTPTPEPAQNAAGVWHYTCSNGCEGGSGTAGTCSKCGGTLAHNQAYHQ